MFILNYGPFTHLSFSSLRSTCTVGFEASGYYTKPLQDLELSYRKCGWNVNFFTE